MVLKVKIERVSREITQFRFAQMLDIDPQRWRKFERGERETPPEVAQKASEVLGLPVDDLFKPVELEVAHA